MSLFQGNKYVGFLGENPVVPSVTRGIRTQSSNLDYMNMGNNVFNGVRTFSFWFRPARNTSAMGGDIETIMARFDIGSNIERDFFMYYDAGGLFLYKFNSSGGNTNIRNTGAMFAGVDYYITITVDAFTGVKIYVDNAQKFGTVTGSDTNPFKTNTIDFEIGRIDYTGVSTRYANQTVWGLSIWNNYITLAEHITNSTRVFTGSETGLKAHYNFDEITGTLVQDMNANVLYNGTIHTSNPGGVTYVNSTMRVII